MKSGYVKHAKIGLVMYIDDGGDMYWISKKDMMDQIAKQNPREYVYDLHKLFIDENYTGFLNDFDSKFNADTGMLELIFNVDPPTRAHIKLQKSLKYLPDTECRAALATIFK